MPLNDLRYTIRLLRKSPLFTLAVVLTVALGIGANTAIFSVVNAVMLRPLPFAEPDRLYWVAERNDKLNLATFSASVLNYLSWKEQARSFEQLGAVGFASFNLTGRGDPEQFTGGTISPSLLPLLGIQPLAGRAFRDDEDRPGAAKVALVSEGLWKRRFGGDPALVGGSLILNGVDTLVVGIAPPALSLLSAGDIWVPMTIDPGRENRLNHVILAVGRLRRGVTMEQAQSEMDNVAARVGAEYPEVKDWGIRLVTFYNFFVQPQLRTALVVLLGAVACVLLIASANVANLLLARASSRQKEIAVRTAMGASRARLIRQMLVESLVLSSIGGAVGVLAAMWAIDAIGAIMPPNLLPVPDIHVDSTVLLFALGATAATGILFGLAPAWHASRTDLNDVLKQASRGSSGGARPLVRNGLAAAELALATMLLIGAGLLGQSLVPPAAGASRISARPAADVPGRTARRRDTAASRRRCSTAGWWNRCARYLACATRRSRAGSRSAPATTRRRRSHRVQTRRWRRTPRFPRTGASSAPASSGRCRFRCCAGAISPTRTVRRRRRSRS